MQDVVKDAFKWDMVLMPKGPAGNRGGHLHADSFAITSTSKNKELAYELCKHLTDKEAGVGFGSMYGLACRFDTFQDERLTKDPLLVKIGKTTEEARAPWLGQPAQAGTADHGQRASLARCGRATQQLDAAFLTRQPKRCRPSWTSRGLGSRTLWAVAAREQGRVVLGLAESPRASAQYTAGACSPSLHPRREREVLWRQRRPRSVRTGRQRISLAAPAEHPGILVGISLDSWVSSSSRRGP